MEDGLVDGLDEAKLFVHHPHLPASLSALQPEQTNLKAWRAMVSRTFNACLRGFSLI